MFQFLPIFLNVLAQEEPTAMIGGALGTIVALVFSLIPLIAMWKVFTKAGKPGWAVLIPIYNLFVLLEIVGRPAWWLFMFFIPLVNVVLLVFVAFDLAKSFGKGNGFGLGLVFLSLIFILILGFGSAEYVGPAAAVAPI
jgi:hypothetical protein